MFPLDNPNSTIDSIYKELLEKLTNDHRIRDVSNKLITMTENDKRVLYVYELIKTYKFIPMVLKIDKDEYVSAYYRNLGNLLYKRLDLYGAWQYYNLALMNSPLHSMSYSLALSNRSAVFAGLYKYKECLKDIEKVFTITYPENIRDKLIKRRNQCEEALQDKLDPEIDEADKLINEVFKFKGAKDEEYVAASSKLKVKFTPELGRHVVANKDIEVGEIIVQEDPYVRVLLKSQYVYSCAHCFSRDLNLYPCPFCCVTMYCSRTCAQQAWKEYHSFECPLIATLVKLNFSKLELLALRTTIKARTDYEDWSRVLEVVVTAEASVGSDHWGHITKDDGSVYDSKFYPSIHTLSTNVGKRDISDIFQKTVSAAVLMYLLAMANFIKTDDSKLKLRIRSFLADSLLRHLMTAPTNMHSITTNVEDEDGHYVEDLNIGCAAYAFLSLINHSCAPNVVRYSRLGTAQMTLIALRPIKEGMQILDNYGAHHAVHTKEMRHTILKSQYKFTCICEACIDNWPVYRDLRTIPNLPVSIDTKINECLNGEVIEALQNGDKKRALEMVEPLCELATALDPYIPCKEAAECQEALKQCYAILSGVLPKGFNNIAEWGMPPPSAKEKQVSFKFYTGEGANDLND